jgi:hypothetical protein
MLYITGGVSARRKPDCSMCVLILTTIYVCLPAIYYICVLILLYVCLLYMCPYTTCVSAIYMSSYCDMCVCYICVRIYVCLLYMCPHTICVSAIYMSSYCDMCVCHICVRILLYVRLPAICVSSY